MKAIVVKEVGTADVLKLEDLQEPIPKPNEVKIQIKAIGVNFIDIYYRTGLYKRDLPFIPGEEAAGVITQVGADVSNFEVGNRVVYAMIGGSYAEYNCVPENKVIKLPVGVDVNQGAACLLQGLTAHYLTQTTFPLKPGNTVLIHAAAGGVGLLLVQIAKIFGAFVIATTSSREKADLVKKFGADVVLNYQMANFSQEVKQLTQGKGVDVIYDSVGKSTFNTSLDCLRPRGYLVLFGQSSGPVDNFNPALLAQKGSLFLTRPSITHYIASTEELSTRAHDLFAWIKSGKVKLVIDSIFSLDEAAAAQSRLEMRKNIGKVILKI